MDIEEIYKDLLNKAASFPVVIDPNMIPLFTEDGLKIVNSKTGDVLYERPHKSLDQGEGIEWDLRYLLWVGMAYVTKNKKLIK